MLRRERTITTPRSPEGSIRAYYHHATSHRGQYSPAQLATFRGCPNQAPPASRVGAGNMIMEASVEMEKIEPGVVVAQQPVVARDPGEALAGGISAATSATASCCASRRRSAAGCCAANQTSTGFAPWTPEIDTLGKFGRRTGRRSRAARRSPSVPRMRPGAADATVLAPGSRPTTLTYHAARPSADPVQAPRLHERSEPVDRAGRRRTRPSSQLLLPSVPRHARRPRPEAGPARSTPARGLFVPKYRVLGLAGEAWTPSAPTRAPAGCAWSAGAGAGARSAAGCRLYVRHPETRAKLDGGNAVFVDLWAGWAAEMCTRRDLYEMKFPAGATSARGTLAGLAPPSTSPSKSRRG